MKKQWWHDKVAYQIYPKSFSDTNGDGIGDIQGIINKLDYLKDLGIDIIWISPMYKSPCVDQGYDVADYYSIDPMFGTMEDMDTLLEEAKKRDMHILMDLVVNHCSSEHEWFKKAMADPDGEYGKYFYIKEAKEDGSAPNNWRTYFGGSVWEKIPNTNKYYLHMYAKEQPDLNWENPVVREKIFEMINWWLEKGLAGFRIDAIINIKKDLTFDSYEADRDDGLVKPQAMVKKAVGVTTFLKEMKTETFDKHSALGIAELFDYDASQLEEFIGEDGCFSTIFDFDTDGIGSSEKGWYARVKPTANQYRDTVFNTQKLAKDVNLICNIIENHDEPRGVCRYLADTTEESKKMLATFITMIKGMPFLFQGQEIGMENNMFESIDDINDLNTIDEYNVALSAGKSIEEALEVARNYSRDNGRTPMQWDNTANAGFTTGTPWLKLNKNYSEINVKSQLNDENSVFNFYKKLIALRKNKEYTETVVYGDIVPVYTDIDNIMAFYREDSNKKLMVICNNQNSETSIDFNEKVKEVLINNYADVKIENNKIYLKAYQAVVLEV